MADTRQRTTWGTRFRFLTRVVGLTGVLAFAVGVTLLATALPLRDLIQPEKVQATAEGAHGTFAQDAAWVALVGLVAVALALLVELLGLLRGSGRRTAAGTSATVATLAAIALLVFVNAYSFTHHARWDVTRNKQFTLAPDLAERLRALRPESPTTIVVLQKHRMFGTLSDERDSFTKGAEEKVTEKVKDLADLFREFGARFNVEVLDTEAFGYPKQLAELTKDAPELKAAIEAAPENSIFFHANKRVQRLAFNDFMQLDRTASRETNNGRGNLVLLPQGTENFARRVLTVQERRPKVAVCLVAEWLSPADSDGQEWTSVNGMKKALADNGFDVVEIVLKKNWARARRLPDLQPAASTIQESTLERLEGELAIAAARVRAALRDAEILADIRKALDEAQKRSFAERAPVYVNISRAAELRRWVNVTDAVRNWAEANGGPSINEAKEPGLRAAMIPALAAQAARTDEEVKEAEKGRRETDEKVKAAYKDERSFADRRERDVQTKFAHLLADVDMLILPRPTVGNVASFDRIWPAIHKLDKEHVEVIKDFMKAGKPVLACLGPISWTNGPDALAPDGIERLIAERGIELGRDTILFDTEQQGFADLQAGGLVASSRADIPPLLIVEKPADAPHAGANPVAAAVRSTARSVDRKLDLRLRAPRPVYLAPGWQDRLTFAAEFVFTSPDSWNEEKPFPTRDDEGEIVAVPRYEPTLSTDKNWNTRMAERRGPFSVGVAIESKIPAAWVNEDYGNEQFAAALLTPLDSVLATGLTVAANKLDRPTQRLVVFGSGNIFSGPKLEPPQEKLLLHSVNWLSGREDRLPRADLPAWQFPRVEMSDREFKLWRYGTAFGLPLVAVYLGLMVTMVRRLR